MTDTTVIRGFDGELVEPGQPAYDRHRELWNAMVDRRPALIARCTTPADVAAAIRHGRDAGLEIGVKCGGHGILGLAVPDAGLMIDLSPMGEVRVDPARRRAAVQGGALLGTLDRSTDRHGLATTAGNVSHTGVGGLTLGGGMGWLARLHGLACDNVEAYTVVTADGETVRASATEHPDLYWGLRGGGGNFGVVTEFEFRLHPTTGQALVGRVLLRPVRSRGHRRRPGLARPAAFRATRGDPDLRHDHGGRAAVPAGATPRPPGRDRRLRVGRRHGRGSGLSRTVPPDRDAAGRGDRRDALRRPAEQRR